MLSFFSSKYPAHSDISLLNGITNPLPPCPDTPNCVRRSYGVSKPANKLFSDCLRVISDMGATVKEQSRESHRIQAVYKVVIFKDDLHIEIQKQASQCVLHIRSASREGAYDFGVNARRVNLFMKKLGRII